MNADEPTLAMLLANGWFLRPMGFDQRRNGPSVAQRQRNAVLRMACFLAAWIPAFAFLPLWTPVAALAVWIAKITPGIRRVNERFQNVGANEEPA